MRLLITAALGIFLSFSSLAKQNLYSLDSELSALSFATTKLQYVIEPASITGLTGGTDQSGKLKIEVPIANLDTGVPIRNERLNKLFFTSEVFPTAIVEASIPGGILDKSLVVTQQTIPAKVTLFGNSQDIQFKVNIVKTNDVLAVSTVAPVIVRGSGFGIPADNLAALAQTVGGISISDAVPVTFSLILKK